MSELLNNLNEQQIQAVTHTDGPLMIVAGAGTGKTTVITKRIAWLIEQGFCKTDEILALTFTEKAAHEMDERLDVILPYGYLDRWIMTFHSFCEQILRENALDIGLSNDFKLLDEVGQWIFIKKNLSIFNLNYYRPAGNPTKFINALIKHFSRAKDELVDSQDYLDYAQDLLLDNDSPDFVKNLSDKVSKKDTELIKKQEVERINELANAYHLYNRLIIENNFLDFGDLIFWTIKLFNQRPAILQKYRDKFKYILVDEFQDTNYAQYELIKILAAPKNNLLIVGDDDQAIFKFRGASISNILQFKQDYPDSKEVVLKNNYRSCQEILDCSYEFIKKNNPNRLEVKLSEKISKKLISSLAEKAIIEHLHFNSLEQEVEKTIDKLIELKDMDQECTWNDFCILVRANDSSNFFINELEIRQIPFQFMALRGLYSKNIILDVVSYLKILVNHHDNASMYRVLKMKTFDFLSSEIAKLAQEAKKKAESIYEILKKTSLIKNISPDCVKKSTDLISLIEKHGLITNHKKASEIFITVLQDLGILKYLTEDVNKTKKEEIEYLQQFLNKIKKTEDLQINLRLIDFMEIYEMEIDAGDQGRLNLNPDEGPEMVKILTVHSAKGLEFKYVFVVNMVDRKFPTTEKKELIPLPDKFVKETIGHGDLHLQEERRLFYVAMTRAKKGLFFTSASDYGGARPKKLSRFLYELELAQKILDNHKAIKKENNNLQIKKTTINSEQLKYLLPPKFSFTQLEAFKTCPYQYKLTHILNIPKMGKDSLSFGRSLHQTLLDFCTKVQNSQKKSQIDLFGGINKNIQITLKELLEMYEKNFIDEWYETKEQKVERKNQGKEMLKDFYHDFYQRNPQVAYLELGFTLPVKDYKIFGRIDRIDRLPDKTLEIIDYKTSKPKEKLDKQTKTQLMIYQVAVNELFPEKTSKLTYHFLDGNKQVSFLGKDKEIDNLKLSIIDTIEQIKNSNFEATPGFQCQFCDFKKICEFKN